MLLITFLTTLALQAQAVIGYMNSGVGYIAGGLGLAVVSVAIYFFVVRKKKGLINPFSGLGKGRIPSQGGSSMSGPVVASRGSIAKNKFVLLGLALLLLFGGLVYSGVSFGYPWGGKTKPVQIGNILEEGITFYERFENGESRIIPGVTSKSSVTINTNSVLYFRVEEPKVAGNSLSNEDTMGSGVYWRSSAGASTLMPTQPLKKKGDKTEEEKPVQVVQVKAGWEKISDGKMHIYEKKDMSVLKWYTHTIGIDNGNSPEKVEIKGRDENGNIVNGDVSIVVSIKISDNKLSFYQGSADTLLTDEAQLKEAVKQARLNTFHMLSNTQEVELTKEGVTKAILEYPAVAQAMNNKPFDIEVILGRPRWEVPN